MPYTPYSTIFKDPNPKSSVISPVSIYPLTLAESSLPPVQQSISFFHTADVSYEWEIPIKLYGTNVSVVVIGAGGHPHSATGGKAGRVTGTINVSTMGTALGYYVATTGTSAGDGGGMSAVWSPSLSTYLVIAGGGGGGGAFVDQNGGDGGSILPSGSANSGLPLGLGGGGASNGTPGSGGTGITANGFSGSVSSLPAIPSPPSKTGGAGAEFMSSIYGGDGGDGYAGGGGGGYTSLADAGGGGGGSNYANTTYVSSAVGTKGVAPEASVTFTWLEYP